MNANAIGDVNSKNTAAFDCSKKDIYNIFPQKAINQGVLQQEMTRGFFVLLNVKMQSIGPSTSDEQTRRRRFTIRGVGHFHVTVAYPKGVTFIGCTSVWDFSLRSFELK